MHDCQKLTGVAVSVAAPPRTLRTPANWVTMSPLLYRISLRKAVGSGQPANGSKCPQKPHQCAPLTISLWRGCSFAGAVALTHRCQYGSKPPYATGGRKSRKLHGESFGDLVDEGLPILPHPASAFCMSCIGHAHTNLQSFQAPCKCARRKYPRGPWRACIMRLSTDPMCPMPTSAKKEAGAAAICSSIYSPLPPESST
jgi:hypothetical protein